MIYFIVLIIFWIFGSWIALLYRWHKQPLSKPFASGGVGVFTYWEQFLGTFFTPVAWLLGRCLKFGSWLKRKILNYRP